MKNVKALLSVLLTVIVSLAATITCLYCILLIFGFRSFILHSASMEPSYKKGSFIVAETRIRPDDLQIGDVIVYDSGTDVPVMHRLVAENTLKGDANQMTEHIVLRDDNLVGRVRYAVFSPLLASIITVLKTHVWIPVIFICACTIILCFPERKVNIS